MLLLYRNAVILECTCSKISISLSSSEARYTVLFKAAKTILWLRNIFIELDTDQQPAKLLPGRSGSIECANERAGLYFSKQNHIDMRHNHIISLVEVRQIYLIHVPSKNMKADILTEVLLPGNVARTITVA